MSGKTHGSQLYANSPSVAFWTLADLIDLEVVVASEEGHPEAALKERDRKFFLTLQNAEGSSVQLGEKSRLLHLWLRKRVSDLWENAAGPGEQICTAVSQITWLGAIIAFVLVFLATVGALYVNQTDPVTVPVFAIFALFLPFGTSLLGFYFLIGGRISCIPRPPAIFRDLFARSISKILHEIVIRVESILPQNGVDQATRVFAELRMRLLGRGGILTARIASAIHFIGLGAVMGLFLALVFFKAFSDQRFVWKTLSESFFTNERVFHIVQGIALPWGWWAPAGSGYPSLAQIEDSRFHKGDKLENMSSDPSVPWSFFLVMGSLVYGVIPRIMLCVAGRIVERRALQRENFTEHRFEKVWKRMVIPLAEIALPGPEQPDTESMRGARVRLLSCLLKRTEQTGVKQGRIHSAPPASGSAQSNRSTFLLIPEHLSPDKYGPPSREALLQQHLIQVDDTRSLPSLPSQKTALLLELVAHDAGSGLEVIIVQEAFRAYGKGTRKFLEECRSRLGAKTSLRLLLVGEPNPSGGWLPAEGEHRQLWDNFLKSIGDPRLSLLTVDP